MRLQDLIDLFVDDEDDVLRPHDLRHDDLSQHGDSQHGEVVARGREDNSSLADIVRILRELDGQYDTERDSR